MIRLVLILIVVALVLWVLQGRRIRRLARFARFSRSQKDPDAFARNLMTIGRELAHAVVPLSSSPQSLPVAAQQLELPETFLSEDQEINVEEFLNDTNSTGMLILVGGEVVYERYWQGMTTSDVHMSFSVAKSITSTLVGMAVEDGIIESLDDPVDKYESRLVGTGFEGVTIAQCMEMSAGTDFQEDYEKGKPSDMPRFQKHFAMGKPMIDFMQTIGRAREPGTFNGYSSLDCLAAGLALEAALGSKSLSQYMYERLWDPIGAEQDGYWMTDPQGRAMTPGGFHGCLRDYAKFGQLFLQKGRWGDRQLISEEYVERATTPHAPHLMPGLRADCLKPWGYGYLWWTHEYPYAGDYFASGIHGEYVYICPEKDLVIAKLTANTHFYDRPESYKLNYADMFQAIARSL